MKRLELLAPARDYASAVAAVDAGADAIYIGGARFGARHAAANSVDDIRRATEYAHLYGVRVHATLNTLLYDDELAAAERQARELLEMLGMEHRTEHKPAELSGGEQQRVAIARALINSPAVLLADEPSGNLDTKNKEEIHKLFFTLRDTLGQTVVIVTHDEQLARMSDREIMMVDGWIRP